MLVNLHRFSVNMFREDGSSMLIDGSLNPPRLQERFIKTGEEHKIPIYVVDSAIVIPTMPDPEMDVFYIVPIQIAAALKRSDLITPHNAVRNSSGRLIGFRSFKQWIS